MSEDINSLKQAGRLPSDVWAAGEPVNEAAHEQARVKTVKELLVASHDRALRQDPNAKRIITTGHYGVDEITGGFKSEFVWVFGADTSWGKSSIAVSWADENIKLGHRVLVVPVEDSDKLYADRLMVRRSRVPMSTYMRHRLGHERMTAEHMSAITSVASAAEDCPVYLDGRGKPVEWIAKKAKELIRREKIDLVMFDYLQAFDNQKPQADRRNQLNYIARLLTDTVKVEGAAGVIFSQLTVRDDKTPDRHSVKDSRDVTNAAEVVALGFHAQKEIISNGERIAAEGEKVLFIDKNKDGPPKKIFGTRWHNGCACFDSVLDPFKQNVPDDSYWNQSLGDL